MIKSILYSDVYRPMAYSLISVFMVYSLRKEKTKRQIFFYIIYILYAIIPFSLFSVLVILENEHPTASSFLWGIERIVFYIVIVIVQHFVYKIGGIGKNKDLLIINAVIALISSFIVMTYFI
ncbi:MAG: hypothetical protein NC313_09260 [Butyrivibrio sp.]|nr:hypothetical protein [Butyrivibrio sp.]